MHCNPYLALAGILAAGLDGIENKIDPPAPVNANIFEMSEKSRKRNKIASLPGDLYEAVSIMKNNPLVNDVLGTHVIDKYIEAKTSEWVAYRTKVTQWELDSYLTKY